MTEIQHIKSLEEHTKNLENKIMDVNSQLGRIIVLIEKINKGLYGDEENDHIGVIARQKLFNDAINNLEHEIKLIHQKNLEQDIALQAKKTIKTDLFEAGKEIVTWVIKAILLIGIYKGFIDKDALL